jgi:uncharacterized protein (TIGR03066 family)
MLSTAGAVMTKSQWMIPMCVAAVAAISFQEMTYGADSPHSRSSIGSIFNEVPGQGGAFQAGRPEPDPSAKPVTLTRVVELLDEAGLQATVEGENAATLQLKHNRFTLPIAISLDADRERVRLQMQLTDLNGQPALASERLLGLLATNMDFQPMFFSFSDKRKRIELVSSVANVQTSAESLRDELSKMAAIAESTANLWEVNAAAAPAASATPAPSNQPVVNNQAAPSQLNAQTQAPSAGASNFVGKWSAARSQSEAFAMQLNTDGSFVLVFVKDGKQSKSSGKFTLGGNQMILTTSDGGKFTGQVANLTAKSFEFTPVGGKASKLTFQRAS